MTFVPQGDVNALLCNSNTDPVNKVSFIQLQEYSKMQVYIGSSVPVVFDEGNALQISLAAKTKLNLEATVRGLSLPMVARMYKDMKNTAYFKDPAVICVRLPRGIGPRLCDCILQGSCCGLML